MVHQALHHTPAIGDIPLRRLRVDHLEQLYQQLAVTGGRHHDGLAPKTILEVHMIVRAALGLARTFQVTNRVPGTGSLFPLQIGHAWPVQGVPPGTAPSSRM